MKANLCPKCFASLDDSALTCLNPRCRRAGLPVPPEEQPEGAPHCPECQGRLEARLCARCGYLAEDADRAGPVLPVSIVGSQGSGKSNYLTVLIEQLKREMCDVYGCSLYPAGGERTMDYFNQAYRRPLYEQGLCVPSTLQEDIDPLTYTLVFPPENKAGKTCTVSLYDACGANFESEDTMTRYNRSIYNSAGIIFLLDPSQLPVLRESRKVQKLSLVEGDAQAALLRCVHLIRKGLGMDSVSKKIDIPLAVCLSKLDLVYDLLDPACFLKDSSRNLRKPLLSAADLASCSMEAQALIESWGGSELIGHIKTQFSHSCFFGFSALGTQPGERGEIPRVNPHRTPDPLLWILSRNSILHTN